MRFHSWSVEPCVAFGLADDEESSDCSEPSDFGFLSLSSPQVRRFEEQLLVLVVLLVLASGNNAAQVSQSGEPLVLSDDSGNGVVLVVALHIETTEDEHRVAVAVAVDLAVTKMEEVVGFQMSTSQYVRLRYVLRR